MNLGPLIQGLGTARLGYAQGQQARQQSVLQQQAAQQAHDEQVKQAMLKIALDEAARRQTQANTDRAFGLQQQQFGLQQNADQRAAAKEAYDQSQPKAPTLGTPQYMATEAALADARARAAAKYRESPGAGEIAALQFKAQHPELAGADKPPTESQAKANSFLKIMQAEEPTISAMENTLPDKYLTETPVLGNIIIGKKHPQYQAQKAAADRWVNQYLRFQSGATISESEFDQARKQFIPQPGDTPDTIAAKAQARARAVEGMREATRQGANTPGATPDLTPNDRAAALKKKYGVH